MAEPASASLLVSTVVYSDGEAHAFRSLDALRAFGMGPKSAQQLLEWDEWLSETERLREHLFAAHGLIDEALAEAEQHADAH